MGREKAGVTYRVCYLVRGDLVLRSGIFWTRAGVSYDV